MPLQATERYNHGWNQKQKLDGVSYIIIIGHQSILQRLHLLIAHLFGCSS
jgi:hypothetical protein